MEKITTLQFYYYGMDIMNFVKKYIDITEMQERYKNTSYLLTNKEINEYKITENNIIKVKVTKDSGVTVIPLAITNKGFAIVNPVCYVRNIPEDQESVKNLMFHELIHVGSITQKIDDKNQLIRLSGINKMVFSLDYKDLDLDYKYLNEAMTELIAKFIYDKLYDDTYKIVKLTEDMVISSGYAKNYFLLAFLLLNYFEDHPDVLFNIYFNNNIDLFEKVLEENTNFTLKKLNKLMNELQENPNGIWINLKYARIMKKIYSKNPIRNKEVIYEYNHKN